MGELIAFESDGVGTEGYLALPPSGHGPGLLVIQEYWGLVDHIESVTDRFAAAGFVALAPDLYHGETTTRPDEAGRKMMALDIQRVASELRAAAVHLLSLPAVSPKKIAVVGFCMGGQLALAAATEHGDVIHAGVDYYGIHPSVSLDFGKLAVPVLAHFGRRDEYIPEAQARELIAAIEREGGRVEGYFYDAGHAFFNDTRPEVYDDASAELSWGRTIDFLNAHLA